MKKLLFIFIALLTILCGCSSNESGDDGKHYSLYFEDIYNKNIDFGDSTLCLSTFSAYQYTDNYSLTINFKIKNNTFDKKKYSIKSPKIEKEETSFNYQVRCDGSLTIDAELVDGIEMMSTIPSDFQSSKYKLIFGINDYKFTIYLHGKPIEFRDKWTVTYRISDYSVKKVEVVDKFELEKYIYEAKDHSYYCDTWYTDKECHNKYINGVVTEDMVLYGKKQESLALYTTGSDVYTTLSSVNYVFSDGIIIVPRKHNEKKVVIGNYPFSVAARNGLKEIYIPKEVVKIYNAGFEDIGWLKVYYEGTESEWASLFYNQSNIYTKNVYYNSTMPY